MGLSRLRKSPKSIFDCFLEIAKPYTSDDEPFILQSFPVNYKDKESDKLKSVPHFTFPCSLDVSVVQNYSFIMTDSDSKWTFGFCRAAPNCETALVFISALPWHETFYKMLNHAAELIAYHNQDELFQFLHASHTCQVPESGQMLHFNWVSEKVGVADFAVATPHHLNLPSIPENRNLTEYFNAVKAQEMMVMFSSLLHERRIIVTSRRLSRLSACVQAANALLYPMSWQHILIPILPKHLSDYLSAPMPYLIGVPLAVIQRVKSHELGDVVILNADDGTVSSPFNDLDSLPPEVRETLKKGFKRDNFMGDTLSRTFLSAVVHLIGGYREALKLRQDDRCIGFDDEVFLLTRPAHMRPFMKQMLELQLFRQFVEERVQLLESGSVVSDEFQAELVRYDEQRSMLNSSSNQKLKAQAAQLKREGGAFVKAVQKKANPAVRSAVKSVRDGSRSVQSKSKSAIRDIRSKLPTNGSDFRKTSSGSQLRSQRHEDEPEDGSLSAPASPVMSHRALSRQKSSTLAATTGLMRTNTDLNLKGGDSLRYEKLESSRPSTKVPTISPELENLPNLNMELMPEMHEVIYRQTSPLSKPPRVNRQLKPCLATTSDSSSATTANGRPKAFRNVEENLICLGTSKSQSIVSSRVNSIDEVIFDPLLEKEMHTQQQASHKPLHRSLPNPAGNQPKPVYSTSSENLLLEYGLDFSQLSLAKEDNKLLRFQPDNKDAKDGRTAHISGDAKKSDLLLSQLDPLFTSSQPKKTAETPIAPPRSRKPSTMNWTTFE